VIKKIFTHFFALAVGAIVTFSFTTVLQTAATESAPSDMTVVVYRVAEQLMEPKMITTNSKFKTSLNTADGKRIDFSIEKMHPQPLNTSIYQDVTVNGQSVKIDSNGTAIVGDIMVVLVDHSKYNMDPKLVTR
jgi:hypothetical protein